MVRRVVLKVGTDALFYGGSAEQAYRDARGKSVTLEILKPDNREGENEDR